MTGEHDLKAIEEADPRASHEAVERPGPAGCVGDSFQNRVLADGETHCVEAMPGLGAVESRCGEGPAKGLGEEEVG